MTKGTPPPTLSGTDLVHADELRETKPVAPGISVSTTFRYINPHNLDPKQQEDASKLIYSRYTQETVLRVERVLSKILKGHAITYGSGLASAQAAIMHYVPKRIAISGGYHGVHATIEVYKRAKGGSDLEVIGLDDPYRAGDLCWLETPLNPTGEARDIQHYADKIHAVGGKLVVDSTFAPPPLQDPFQFGADCVMHSSTKYFGGHSDLLGGVLVVKTWDEFLQLWTNRTYSGNVMGSLESWLLLRSLRTLHLRIPRQSATATELAAWLRRISEVPAGKNFDGVDGGVVEKVWHSSLQAGTAGWDVKRQMDGGWNPTFSFLLKTKELAESFPDLLKYFVSATSLGGVESLIEWRIRSDTGADPRLLRISVGVEELEDLKGDLRQAFQKLSRGHAKL